MASKAQARGTAASGLLPAEPFDRSGRLWHELSGTLVILAGLFVLLCLVFGRSDTQQVGIIGSAIASGITFFTGLPLSWIVPAGIVWLGIGIFRRHNTRWSAGRICGMLLFLAGISGLLAIPGADNPELREENFIRAGALGTFLVEWDGLRLVGQFGNLGAALMLTGLLVVGAVLTTGLEVSTILSSLAFWKRDSAEAPEDDSIGPEDETPAPILEQKNSPVRGPRRSFLSYLPRFSFGRRESAAERPGVLTELKDFGGDWEEPADADVAAAARALEVHEWESRLSKRIKVRHDAFDDAEEADLFDEYEEEDEDQEELETLDDSEDLEDEAEEEVYDEDQEIGEEEDGDEGDDDIIFTDATSPMPIREGNPANVNVGEGLARLFPSRWPKEGTPADAQANGKTPAAETQEEVFDKSEARQLRRTSVKIEPDSDTGDPLFHADYDTRPYGPNGEPLEDEEVRPAAKAEPHFYHLPDIQLLEDPPQVDARMSREEVLEMSQTLSQTLADFGVDGRVTQVHQGPVVTRFEFRPAAGIKVSRITGLEHDIAMGMKALSVRILAPIPGKNTVGIEVPNKKRQGVYLKELISCEEFWEHKSPLAFALGKTIDGSPHFADLAKMPHLLIAGATGAGKSVCLNTIICSLLYRRSPDEVKLIMVDPKRVELSVYSDIPHLIAPVVCEPKRAASALEWAVDEMEQRYETLVKFGVRNIDGYNRLAKNPESNRKTAGRSIEPMPYMVVIVDELADLMIVAKAEVEESIQRLAQMARAVGIHLILATQRPSVNVITGIIKANFPSRIAFQVSQKVDSRTILDSNGAEALLGKGDMLLSAGGAGKPVRIQGAFLSDEEVERIAEHCREQQPVMYEIEEFEPKLSEKEQKELAKMMGVQSMDDLDAQDRMVRGTNKVMGKVTAGMFIPHDGGSARAGDDEIDEALVRAAARLILESRKASVSLLQRRLKVGFARAGRLMDMLEDMGIVGEFKGSKPREIIVDCEAALEQLDKLEVALSEGVSVEEIRAEEDDEYEDEPTSEDEYSDEELHAG